MKKEITYWPELANKYNTYHGRINNLFDLQIKKIGAYLNLDNCNNVLDAGCGAGRLLIPISEQYSSIQCFGVEYSKSMYEQCMQNILDSAATALVQNISFQDFIQTTNLKFDAVFFSYSLHQIEYEKNKQIEILHKTFDTLNPKRILLITASDQLFDKSLLNLASPKLNQFDRSRFLQLNELQKEFDVAVYENEMNYLPYTYEEICDMIDNKFISSIQILNDSEIQQLKDILKIYMVDLQERWTDYYTYITLERK